ncbi:hypothetical protein F8388_019711 (mitochondrion) [Cannabis sativa]|uniref:Uncharacterized protein n=1 Tax=Cannabis sativa TaxID=3483 RepID=A0A7J6DLE0_CANSA|nr:hypothetical protein F8388_019711 [Cannabis sativa]
MGEGGGTAHFRVQSIVRVNRQRLPSKAFLKSFFLSIIIASDHSIDEDSNLTTPLLEMTETLLDVLTHP